MARCLENGAPKGAPYGAKRIARLLALGITTAVFYIGCTVPADNGKCPIILDDGTIFDCIIYRNTKNNPEPKYNLFIFEANRSSTRMLLLDSNTKRLEKEDFLSPEFLGASGNIRVSEGQVGLPFLIAEVPVDEGRKQWNKSYARRDFKCQKQITATSVNIVTCTSDDMNLSYSYSQKKGVLSYDDFCDNSVCSYKLIGEKGLFSQR
jgi:hypothetical protein